MTTKLILVTGLSGSGKSTFSRQLAGLLDAEHIDADKVREKAKDWEFDDSARLRQVYRMLGLGLACGRPFAILDFICPLQKFRAVLGAGVTVFMDTVQTSQYKDTDRIYEPPGRPDFTFQHHSPENAKLVASSLLQADACEYVPVEACWI